MIQVEDHELLAFFECEPESRPEDEREFFDAPTFVKEAGGLRLVFSISRTFHDLSISLSQAGGGEAILDYVVKSVVRVAFDRDADGREWMRVQSEAVGDLSVAVRPSIEIRASHGEDVAEHRFDGAG